MLSGEDGSPPGMMPMNARLARLANTLGLLYHGLMLFGFPGPHPCGQASQLQYRLDFRVSASINAAISPASRSMRSMKSDMPVRPFQALVLSDMLYNVCDNVLRNQSTGALEMARPFSFSKEKADRLIEMIRDGATQEQAARAVGVTRSTLLRWLREGREGVPRFVDFAREYGDLVRTSRRGRSEEVWAHPSDVDESSPPPEAVAYKRPVRVDSAPEELKGLFHNMRGELSMLRSNAEAQYHAARVHRDYVRHEVDRLNRRIEVLLDTARAETGASDEGELDEGEPKHTE